MDVAITLLHRLAVLTAVEMAARLVVARWEYLETKEERQVLQLVRLMAQQQLPTQCMAEPEPTVLTLADYLQRLPQLEDIPPPVVVPDPILEILATKPTTAQPVEA